MKKTLNILVIALAVSLVRFSLCFADFANWTVPQLEYITNAFPILWNKPKSEVLRIMSLFPDFICTDYGDQIGCVSKYNTNANDNIFISFFTDDYEEHHDNLWKTAVTVDLQSAGQSQDLINILWLDGLKPFHTDEDDFSILGALPLYFNNEATSVIYYVPPFDPQNGSFFLAEYFSGSMR